MKDSDEKTIFKVMNKDLKNDFYKFPVELLSHLMKNLNGSNKSENGFKRLKGICDQKGMGYKQAKKIKHEMENDMEPTVYKLIVVMNFYLLLIIV